MQRRSRQRIRAVVILGLFLVVLANPGLTAHGAHDPLGTSLIGSTTRSVADHRHPDPSLHLEAVTEVQIFDCPACQLHQQVGGSELPALRGLARLQDWTGIPQVSPSVARPADGSLHPTRGPPSC